jgi:hypothetical protein
MILQRLIVRLFLPLQDLHDDGRKAFAVEVHFLVVGDLADIAIKNIESVIRIMIVHFSPLFPVHNWNVLLFPPSKSTPDFAVLTQLVIYDPMK